jgi:hypothetical protein
VEVADLVSEEQATNKAQYWIPKVAMERRHGTWRYPTPKSITHHEIRTSTESFKERRESREVVAVVGIAHDDVPAAGSQDPTEQSVAVSTLGYGDHASASALRYKLTTIRAAVISNDDFSVNVVLCQERDSLPDARTDGLGFIQAGHEHCELQA